MRVVAVAVAVRDASSSDAANQSSSGPLSGRTLAILIVFIALFILVVSFAYARRNAHARALADAHDGLSSSSAHRRRRGERPRLTDVQLLAPAPGSPQRGTWRSMQPLAARVDVPPLARSPRQRPHLTPPSTGLGPGAIPPPSPHYQHQHYQPHQHHHQRRPPQPPQWVLHPPPPPIPRAGSYVHDYGAVIGDAWFTSARNANAPPDPPAPVPRARRGEPVMNVAVLIAMPTPPSPRSPSPPSPTQASSSETRDTRSAADARTGPPAHVAIGVVRVPWRQREGEGAALWNFESTVGLLI